MSTDKDPIKKKKRGRAEGTSRGLQLITNDVDNKPANKRSAGSAKTKGNLYTRVPLMPSTARKSNDTSPPKYSQESLQYEREKNMPNKGQRHPS